MQAVTCPRCGRELNVGREVHNVRLRCKACGEVFMGSTHPADGPKDTPAQPSPANSSALASAPRPASAAVSEEQRARRAALAAARQKSVVPMVLAIVGAVGAIVLIIVAFWLYNNPVVKVWDPQTQQYITRRVTRAEAARLKEQERKRKEQSAAMGPSSDGQTVRQPATPPDGDGGSTDVRDRPLKRYTGPDIGETQVMGDKHSRVTDLRLNFSDVGASGKLTARFRNTHSDPVRAATITITAINEAGARRSFKPAGVRWVPPSHYVRFSIPFAGFSKEEGYAYLIKVDVQRDADMLCFPVSPRGVGYEVIEPDTGGTIELDGAAKNLSSSHSMINPKVIADFYKPSWYHEGSATGTLIGDGAQRLGPGKNVYFRVRYRPQAQYLQDRYEYQIRLIGKKAL